MTKSMMRLLGATALVLVAAPALANKSDKLFVSQLHDKIVAARGEPGVADNGSAELDRAEATLKPLLEHLEDNDVKEASTITSQIDALIDTARTRAKTAAIKIEIAKLQASGSQRIANAEATAATAQQSAMQAEASADQARQAASSAQLESKDLRSQLQEYQLKQTQLGATLVLRDVVFTSGGAMLQPGSTERLRPLAAYLQGNPAVRVRIDAHTDSQGSNAYNQDLSNRRAAAVGNSLIATGLDRSRIESMGHGELQPVADNMTAAGRQQNRRVEVTLVGQQLGGVVAR